MWCATTTQLTRHCPPTHFPFADKEEHLHDYNARKANIEATELAMWDEELALHTVNVAEAEQAVFRQRVVDWAFREDAAGFAKVMATFAFPFRVKSELK